MSRWIALGCGTMLWLAAGHLVAGNGPATPVHTNKNKFRIPFKFDPAEMKALGAREVRLYVSRDRGGTWQQTQSVPPDSAKFQFQAPGEGEYWFIVRSGRRLPLNSGIFPGMETVPAILRSCTMAICTICITMPGARIPESPSRLLI